MKNHRFSGTGGILLLAVLLVLCLSVFAALTYTSARNDLALSERHAASTKAYYAAESRAAEIIASLSHLAPSEHPEAHLADFAPDCEIWQMDAGGGRVLLHLGIHVENGVTLVVELLRSADASLETVVWRAVSPDIYADEGDSLPVWQG